MNKLIALTFDDGPCLPTTSEILDKLEYYGVPAVFFVRGDRINEETVPVMRRAVNMGCEIGNHSRTHPHLDELTEQEIRDELAYTTERIKQAIGKVPDYFRPPYLGVNDLVLSVAELPVMGGYDADDWLDENNARFRADELIKQAEDGALIFLHDQKDNVQSVEALDLLIPELREQGYEFVTITELFRRKGVKPRKHYMYFTVT